MTDLQRFDVKTWDKFLELIFACDEPMTRAEIQQELTRNGLDTSRGFARVKQALETVQAKASLHAAAQSRQSLIARLADLPLPSAGLTRGRLHDLIMQHFQHAKAAALFHKLERAASEDDLRSLLEDLIKLKELDDQREKDDAGQ